MPGGAPMDRHVRGTLSRCTALVVVVVAVLRLRPRRGGRGRQQVDILKSSLQHEDAPFPLAEWEGAFKWSFGWFELLGAVGGRDRLSHEPPLSGAIAGSGGSGVGGETIGGL